MDTSKEDKQRDVFRCILYDLAKTDVDLSNKKTLNSFYGRLEQLYDADLPENRFRHYYSDIYMVLVRIKRDKALGSIDILSQNIGYLRQEYRPTNKAEDENRIIDIHDALNKLYDHVNLDVARINYIASEDEEVSGEHGIREIQAQISKITNFYDTLSIKQQEFSTKLDTENKNAVKLQKKIGTLERGSKRLKGEAERLQKEYISILGIFAAIVLSFTSGITFSTSVLANISQSSIYRIVIITLLIGLVLVNIFYALFYFVSILVSRKVKPGPFWTSNIILIVLIICTILAWWFGVVELRAR